MSSHGVYRPSRVRLGLASLLRTQGYRDPAQAAPAIRDVAEAMLALADTLIDPAVAYVTRPVESAGGDGLRLAGGPRFRGRCLAAHCAAAREVMCFVATLGPALEVRAGELSDDGQLLEALFLEAAGWLALEDTLRAFRAEQRSRLRPLGLRPGPRLGPGYLDWPLTEQPDLFRLFDAAALPVTLSAHGVMVPRKSLSGLFGIVPRA